MMFIGFIIPFFAILFESYPRFINRTFGVDIWTHLLYLQEYHRQGGIPGKIAGGFLVRGEYDYPPAFITILSKLPYRIVESYEFLFSPIIDALHLIIIFFISYFFSGDVALSIMTQGLYLLTPIIVIENSSATPRSLGYTLFTLVFMCLFVYQTTYTWWYVLAAVILGIYIFLSHRFTSQGFLFFALFFGIMDKSFVYPLVFGISFIAAFAVSGGFYKKVLQGHIANLLFWRDVIAWRFAHQVKGNVKTGVSPDIIFRLYNQFLKFPPFVLTITNPWVLATFVAPVLGITFDPTSWRMGLLVLFSYCAALLTTWIPSLRFLGEGQRYLELSAFPAAYIASRLFVWLTDHSLGSIGIIIYTIIACASFVTIVVIQRKAIIKDTLRTVTPSMEQMFAHLRSYKKKPHLMCIPHQITTNTIYHTGCPVFVNADYSTIGKISEIYPFIRVNLRDFLRMYKLDMILLNTDYAKEEELGLGRYTTVKRVDNFVLLT